MHCPRCGQHQISDETKFCSRCGFQLHLIPRLLANDGTIPELNELANSKSGWFTRKNGLIFTLLWFIVWVMMIPAFFGIAGIDEISAVSAVFGVFSTIMLFVISLAFLKKRSTLPAAPNLPSGYGTRPEMPDAKAAGQLPPQQSIPADQYVSPAGSWRTPDTGELAAPTSVTEETTKLLHRDTGDQ
ncbi:hypothetical protein BH24ACI3_BH24ACI3_09720 [soil metagenome]